MTIADLKGTKEWKLLTEQEQAFLLEYIANGFNVSGAARKAYNTGSKQSATVYGRRVIERPRVTAALEKWSGVEDISERDIWKNLRAAMEQNQSMAVKVSAIRLAAELKGMLGAGKGEAAVDTVPKELVSLLADRLGEMPVGRIMEKLGIHDMKFLTENIDAEPHESGTQQAPLESDQSRPAVEP